MIDNNVDTYTDEAGVIYSKDKKILIKANPSLTEYAILKGTEIIGNYAFYKCINLKSIHLPSSLLKIGDQSFRGCTSIINVLLPDSLRVMHGNAFQECTSIQTIRIPNSTTIIGDLFFCHCDSLEYINIPSTLTQIGPRAFQWCKSLKYVQIHPHITIIGESAFEYCESLCCITCKPFNIEQPVINNEEYKYLKYFFTPLLLKRIEKHAFYNCKKLRNIVFTTCNISVENHAFDYHNSWSSENLKIFTPIGTKNKFKDILSLQNYTIEEYTTLRSLIDRIEDSTSINHLDLLYSEKKQDGSIVSLDGTRLLCAPEDCTEYFIPEGIKYICDSAFMRREKLKSVHIPQSVIRIGKFAFDDCHNLATIELPNQLKSIGDRCFACCYSLQHIQMPDTIRIIPDRAFYYCKNLIEINIGSNIDSIETRAFYYCSKLIIKFISVEETKARALLKKVDEPRLLDRIVLE